MKNSRRNSIGLLIMFFYTPLLCFGGVKLTGLLNYGLKSVSREADFTPQRISMNLLGPLISSLLLICLIKIFNNAKKLSTLLVESYWVKWPYFVMTFLMILISFLEHRPSILISSVYIFFLFLQYFIISRYIYLSINKKMPRKLKLSIALSAPLVITAILQNVYQITLSLNVLSLLTIKA